MFSKIDIARFHEEFKEKKRVVIPNALDSDTAENIHRSISDLDDIDLWYQSQRGNPYFQNKTGTPNAHDFTYRFAKFPLTNINLKSLIGLKADSRKIGYEDALPFEEQPERELPDQHPLRQFGSFINSSNCIEVVKSITDLNVVENNVVCFLSKYMTGDYISEHDDSSPDDSRLLTFVLNLSKNWKQHWGGQTLFFEDESNNTVSQSITPAFNSLVLFEVPMNHCVIPVSQYHADPRYALSGWFLRSKK